MFYYVYWSIKHEYSFDYYQHYFTHRCAIQKLNQTSVFNQIVYDS